MEVEDTCVATDDLDGFIQDTGFEFDDLDEFIQDMAKRLGTVAFPSHGKRRRRPGQELDSTVLIV